MEPDQLTAESQQSYPKTAVSGNRRTRQLLMRAREGAEETKVPVDAIIIHFTALSAKTLQIGLFG